MGGRTSTSSNQVSRASERDRQTTYSEASGQQRAPNNLSRFRLDPLEKAAYHIAWIDWKVDRLIEIGDMIDFFLKAWESHGLIKILLDNPLTLSAVVNADPKIYPEYPPKHPREILQETILIRRNIQKEVMAINSIKYEISQRYERPDGSNPLTEYNHVYQPLFQDIFKEFVTSYGSSSIDIKVPLLEKDSEKTYYDPWIWHTSYKYPNPPPFDIVPLMQVAMAENRIKAIEAWVKHYQEELDKDLGKTSFVTRFFIEGPMDPRTRSSIIRGYSGKFRSLEQEKDRLQKLIDSTKLSTKSEKLKRRMKDFLPAERLPEPPGEIGILWWASLTFDLIPFVGELKSLQELVMGVNLVTGAKLSAGDRAFAAIGCIPLLGRLGKLRKAKTIISVVEDVPKVIGEGAPTKIFAKINQAVEVDSFVNKEAKLITRTAEHAEKAVGDMTHVAEISKAGDLVICSYNGEAQIVRMVSEQKSASEIGKVVAKAVKIEGELKKSAGVIVSLTDESTKISRMSGAISEGAPNVEAFEIALKKALHELGDQASKIEHLEFSGKSASAIFSGAGTKLNDIDVTIVGLNEEAKNALFRRIAEHYAALTGKSGDPIKVLAKDKVVMWRDWMVRMDGLPPATDGIKERAVVRSIDKIAIMRPKGSIYRIEGEAHILTELERMDGKEAEAAVRRYALEALEKYRKEPKSKWVIKAYEAARKARMTQYLAEGEKLAHDAILEMLTDTTRLKEGEIEEFLRKLAGTLDDGTLHLKTHEAMELLVQQKGKNAVRLFLEARIEPGKILPPNIVQKVSDAEWKDFTLWWDKLDQSDLEKIAQWFSTDKAKKLLAEDLTLIVPH